MKNMKWEGLIGVLAMIVLCFMVFVSEGRAEPDLPKIITMTSYPESTAAYAWTTGFRQAIEKFSPMKMRLEPYGADLARFMLLTKKESELACASGGAAHIFSRALWDWKKYGPQAIQIVWSGNPMSPALLTRKDSGINSVADLKGKRVPFLTGGLAIMKSVEAGLAFGGLTWDDVDQVKVSSMRALLGGIVDGSLDVTWSVPFTPAAQTLATSRHGIKWLEEPATDTEGWKRLNAVAPWVRPITLTVGPGISKENPAQLGGYPNSIYSYDFLSEEIVYTVVKAMHEGYQTMKDMHPDLKRRSIDQALDIKWMSDLPYHKGAVKYFKEIGRWTPEHEKWQARQLSDEAKRLGR
jgi:TRAP transporter TAXI family solute receptor